MLKMFLSAAAAIASLAAPIAYAPRPLLVWNASASAPRGLYRIASLGPLHVGALALVRPPISLARFLGERGYVPAGVPLLKHIAAGPAQTVCRRGKMIVIDDHVRATALGRDHIGRPLPVWSGCRRLRRGEVFLLNTAAPSSLDSRYFGPVPLSSIIGRAIPVWTEAAQ